MKRTVSLLLISFLLLGTPMTIHGEEANIQEKIIYNIVVDRFDNGGLAVGDEVRVNDPYAYHGGDIIGIARKLDHIKALGFSALHLSPIMENTADGFHGYWINDHYEIEPLFGTTEDLQKLVEEAHQRGIDVYLEFVPNYISEEHPIATDGTKEDWTKEVDIEQTDATFWLDQVKQLDLDNPDVQAYMMDVAEHWMNVAPIDGFVLHATDQTSPTFIDEFTAHIKGLDPSFVLIADVLNEQANTDSLLENPNIDAVQDYKMYEAFNHVFAQVNTPASHLFDAWMDEYEDKKLLFVDTKNTPRFSYTTAEQSRSALTTWKLALTFMYTVPGTPSILQGSELPMYGPTYLESQYLVPFNSTDPDLEEFHHRISSLRTEFPVLRDGDFEQIVTEQGVSVYKRSNEEETLFVVINNDEELREVTITEDIGEGNQIRGLLTDMIVRRGEEGELTFEIERESPEVFFVEEDTGANWYFIGMLIAIPVGFTLLMIYLVRKGKTRSE